MLGGACVWLVGWCNVDAVMVAVIIRTIQQFSLKEEHRTARKAFPSSSQRNTWDGNINNATERTQSRTLLILLYRPNWLRTTVWPGWIHTAESDWATLYMRPQPHTTEPRTHGGTKSSNARCPQGSTLSTWRSLMRWGSLRGCRDDLNR